MSRRGSRRWSVAAQQGRRGAGLGNEIIALGKAYLGSSELGARLVEQPWWLNPRRYGKELGRNLSADVEVRLQGLWLPRLRLPWSLLPFPWDYRRSMQALSADLPPSCVVVHTSGMAGGYLTIEGARPFLQMRLRIPRNPARGDRPLKVGLHLRAGDFTTQPVRPGTFNARLSQQWIINALVSLRKSWSGAMDLTIVTDAAQRDPLLEAIVERIPPAVSVCVSSASVLGDLRRLTMSDIIVPSVSSYSMMAIFLSDAAYLWPQHHLNDTGGWLSIWGHEREVLEGPVASNIRTLETESATRVPPRGFPLGDEECDLRAWLHHVRQGGERRPENDLVLHGVVKRGSD